MPLWTQCSDHTRQDLFPATGLSAPNHTVLPADRSNIALAEMREHQPLFAVEQRVQLEICGIGKIHRQREVLHRSLANTINSIETNKNIFRFHPNLFFCEGAV